jgi:hypothetical protein
MSIIVLTLALCGPLAPFGSGQGTIDDAIQRQNDALVSAARTSFVSGVDSIPIRGDRGRRQDFRRELGSLRQQVVGFWAFRYAPMSEEWAKRDLDERARELARTLERLREFVNRDSDPPEYDPAVLSGDSFLERLSHFVRVASRLPGLILEVTEGEVLDLATLDRVRTDLASLESWVREFRESVR